jgi:hypothetical protein
MDTNTATNPTIDIEATVQAAVATKQQAEQLNKNLNELGYSRPRPWYELGIGSGLKKLGRGDVVEGGLQILAVPATIAAVGFGTGLIPVPGRAGFSCSK